MARRRRGSESVVTVPFSKVGIDPDRIADPKAPKPDEDYGPFEGPRMSYSLLLGESPTWAGPESLRLYWTDGRVTCRMCGHLRRMPGYAYCLACDRCGRSHLIPPLKGKVGARKSYTPAADGLKGGVGA